MANKYTFRFIADHNNFSHIDIAVSKDGVEAGQVRIAMDDQNGQTIKQDVLDFASDLMQSLKIQRELALITNADAKAAFEAFELWR